MFIKEKTHIGQTSHNNLQDWYRKEFPYKKDLRCQNMIFLFPAILVNDEFLVIKLL